jgi:hypothetical protein
MPAVLSGNGRDDPQSSTSSGTRRARPPLLVSHARRLLVVYEEPEDCLRSLAAEALLFAHPDTPLFPVSLGLMAVANALVMLGLLPEPRAEAILTEHRLALERKGFGSVWGVTKGELTIRPGAHEYWQARAADATGLRETPLSVAAAGVRCGTSIAEVGFEWVRLTPAGLRASFHATGPDRGAAPPPPHMPMQQAMSEISVTDDTGRVYDLSVEGVGWGRLRDRREQEWRGQVLLHPNPASKPSWLEFSPVRAGMPGRVVMSRPDQVPTASSEPRWPSPAECYLAALAPATSVSIATSGHVAEAGPGETAEIIAKVADTLIAVGALPVTSTLLRESPVGGPGWHAPLAERWGRRAHQGAVGFRPAEHRGLAVQLPLQHATAVIESVSTRGELVSIQLYGHPWVMGEYWPMVIPCFQVRAIDDAGNEHEGMAGDWRGFPGHEGSGSFWFWPPVEPACKSIRVTVSTLWEAAWAEVELPR